MSSSPPSSIAPSTPPTSPSDENQDPINCINFNQDSRIINVGHKDGYMFYKTVDVLDSPNLHYEGENTNNPLLKNCLIVERFFGSALMIIVSRRDARQLHVYHIATKNIICDLKYTKTILSVRLNRDRIVVCVEDSIYIYNLKEMKMMHKIMDTPPNKLGIIDLTINQGQALLAYPGNTETGSVHLFDAMNLSSVHTFVAHEGKLAALKFTADASMIATASTKGTVIRVYSVEKGTRMYEFRRGMSRCVTIHSLAFSPDNTYLCSSSNTETIHVFKLEKAAEEEIKKPDPKPEASGGGGWFDVINKTFSEYMPTQVSDLIASERSFATAKLPAATSRTVTALIAHNNKNYVIAASSEGFVYCYRLDDNGGELDLVKQQKIGPFGEGTCRGPISPGGGTDANINSMPDIDDPDEFPPINHTSGI